jgi:diguanylate cyclase (GGDEF)-like protein
MRDGLAQACQAWDLLTPEEQGVDREHCGDVAAEVGNLVVYFNFWCGRHQQALEFGRPMLQVMTLPDHALMRVETLRCLVGCCLELADFEAALNFAVECCDLADHLGDATERSKGCSALGGCYGSMGDYVHAERLMLDALALADQCPAGLVRFVPLNNLCAICINAFFQWREVGDLQSAQSALERSMGYARRLQEGIEQMPVPHPGLSAYAAGNLGEALLHLGRDVEAEEHLRSTLSLAQSLGIGVVVWRMHYLLGELSLKRGQFAQAQALLEQVLQADRKQAGMPTLERTHLAMHRCCKELGLLEQSLIHLEAGRRMGMQRTQAQLAAQSRFFVTRLEADRARQAAERAEAEARRQEARAHAYSEVAVTDPLTGLYNRRHLESRLPALLTEARDAGRPIAVAMLDLDHFKSVNDRFGHPVGDQVLIRMAKILRDRMRSGDHVVRMGGEEILVVLSGAAPGLAMEICERLRQAVSAYPWSELHSDLRVSVSIGLASAPEHDLQKLIDRADVALYEAKNAGRNRVCAAVPV